MANIPDRSSTDGRLIEATLQLLDRDGYRGATTREIAAGAGVSEVTLFRRFGTKASLVAEALRVATAELAGAATRPGDDVDADLVAVTSGYAAFVDRWPGLIERVLPEVAGGSESAEPVHQLLRANVDAVRRLVRHHRRAGRLADLPDADLVRDLLGPVLARASLRAVIRPGRFDAQGHVQRFLDGHRP